MRGYSNSVYCEGQGYRNSVTLFIGSPDEIKKLYLDLRELYVPVFSDYPKFNPNKKLYGLLLNGDLSSDTTYKVVTYEQVCETIEETHKDLLMFPEDNELFRCSFNEKTKDIEVGEKIACLYNEIAEIEYEAGYDADSDDTTAEKHDIHTSEYLDLKTLIDIQNQTVERLSKGLKSNKDDLEVLRKWYRYLKACTNSYGYYYLDSKPLTAVCILALIISIFSAVFNIVLKLH